MEVPPTDVSRPSALPTAHLLHRGPSSQALVEQNSTEYLDSIEEEWNKKVDVEVETLVDGMVDLVGLASVRPASTNQLFLSSLMCMNERLGTRTSSVLHKKHFKLILVPNLWCVTEHRQKSFSDQIARSRSGQRTRCS
jgi:hypothetical protein